jgi:hypothetical protein
MKECFKCNVTKPLSEFYKHKVMADGHLNKCKDCAKKDVASYRAENIEKIRAYDRVRSSLPHRKALGIEINKKWREKHPERRKAHYILRSAVVKGIVKPHPCWVCGEKAEAHHPDYSRPLDVVWLCNVHHSQTHALLK